MNIGIRKPGDWCKEEGEISGAYACTNHHISHNLIAAVQFSLIPKFRNSEIPKIKSNRLSVSCRLDRKIKDTNASIAIQPILYLCIYFESLLWSYTCIIRPSIRCSFPDSDCVLRRTLCWKRSNVKKNPPRRLGGIERVKSLLQDNIISGQI